MQWYGKALQDQDFLSAMWFSTGLAVAATAGRCCSASRPPSRWPVREIPGRDAVASVLLSPLVFPVLITGVALLQLFSMFGFDNTPVNMFIGHVLVTAPYVVRTTTASLLLADTTLEDAARTLGAGTWRVFRRITVPQIAPGLAAGALFAFMISFDNFPISLWLADAQYRPGAAADLRDDRQRVRADGRGDFDPDDPLRDGCRADP